MATRFDRVQTPTRSREDRGRDPLIGTAEAGLAELDLEVRALAARAGVDLAPLGSRDEAREIPAGPLALAMTAWFSLVYIGCYVVAPPLLAVAGLNTKLVFSGLFSMPAFAAAAFAAIVAVTASRPKILLAGKRADPIVAATLGSLAAWAVLHNTSALLVPFSSMSPLEFVSLFGMNVLESTALGMMFASFTRRSSVAFALGGAFQVLMMGLLITFLKLVLLF